eukprot:GHRR01020950.1.p1 GENE.GHRR01020950.1~~GHRR01020950.1.p1  ORF type:complete len:124 (+),score=13.34 GHRR01020950.1:787-1158(+)
MPGSTQRPALWIDAVHLPNCCCCWCGSYGVSPTAHSAECDEGMPPESTIALMSHMPFLIRLVKILRVCAVNQAQKPAKNTLLVNRSENPPPGNAGSKAIAAIADAGSVLQEGRPCYTTIGPIL